MRRDSVCLIRLPQAVGEVIPAPEAGLFTAHYKNEE